MESINKILAEELGIRLSQVDSTLKLIEEGNTIPFIARYRKEATGNLSDEVLRKLEDRLNYLKNFFEKKDDVIRHITELGLMTDDIMKSIENSKTLAELEDIYRPFKPKKRTKATIAKENGLEPLAIEIMKQNIKEGSKDDILKKYINEEKGLTNLEDILEGAKDIITENISDEPKFRTKIRGIAWRTGKIVTKAAKKDESSVYDMYYDFEEEAKRIAMHRVLAINRGEKEKFLKVSLVIEEKMAIDYLEKNILKGICIFTEDIQDAISNAYKSYIFPAIEREIRSDLTEEASENAIGVFGVNVKNLLLQAPLKDVVVMGFDPAFRTGCKIAVIDETGKLLDTTTVYPTEPQNDVAGAEKKLLELIDKYNVNIIAIGNGTASRESEKFVANMIKKCKNEVHYAIVSEAGASVYSASKLATKEYPDINVSLRGAISIARRLQDPLAELVKIDPKSIGVGQYQHDVNQKRLDESLTGVVENAVNSVGVDVNTATPSLLSYVSGITSAISENIVKYRDENGKFKKREELLKVSKLGPQAYKQCAGFLKVMDSKNILDRTMVHPESYDVAEKIIKKYDIKNEKEFEIKMPLVDVDSLAKEFDVGEYTIKDIVEELKKPGRDFRDDMPQIVVKSDVLKITDLKEGMILTGTVRNVTNFGAFVDIGIKGDGLVHISQLSDKFVKDPMQEVSVGDIVKVKVLSVDLDKNKVSLSMKDIKEEV
ncbi:MAG: RNA-binding transcriptional accessory protein [Clostridia bacterium]|nr:RNA-binding transcriptional accessory protein [Clostridia bacterium]